MTFETRKNIRNFKNNTVYSGDFSNDIAKYRKIKDLSQKEFAKFVGVHSSTINSIENDREHKIKVETVKKILEVIEDENILDDYCRFILNQKAEMEKLIQQYGKYYICNTLAVHRSTLERWGRGKYQITREIFRKIMSIE